MVVAAGVPRRIKNVLWLGLVKLVRCQGMAVSMTSDFSLVLEVVVQVFFLKADKDLPDLCTVRLNPRSRN